MKFGMNMATGDPICFWKKKRDAIEMTDEQRARYNLLADKVRAVLNQDEFDELQFLILLRREELEQQM